MTIVLSCSNQDERLVIKKSCYDDAVDGEGSDEDFGEGVGLNGTGDGAGAGGQAVAEFDFVAFGCHFESGGTIPPYEHNPQNQQLSYSRYNARHNAARR